MLCDIENENIKELLFQGEFGLEMESLRVTADGELYYALTEDVVLTGYQQTVSATVEAVRAGSAGNGLAAGVELQLSTAHSAVQMTMVFVRSVLYAPEAPCEEKISASENLSSGILGLLERNPPPMICRLTE